MFHLTANLWVVNPALISVWRISKVVIEGCHRQDAIIVVIESSVSRLERVAIREQRIVTGRHESEYFMNFMRSLPRSSAVQRIM